jgi:hypothetical protein
MKRTLQLGLAAATGPEHSFATLPAALDAFRARGSM